ncbi:hypothetical protein [Pseudarthrobacter oxydans]|uniref:hypothetical protein n=1 Tax=Pseudarthrobacter oxydans TaxID=1671 RepID=UPI0037FAA12C
MMYGISLEARVERFRILVERLDAGSPKAQARLLPKVIDEAEDLGAQLLAAGVAAPKLKAEIIAWVIRFRAEKQRIDAFKPAPVTHTFNYDTSDPRTKDPNFVNVSLAERRAASIAARRRTNFGKDEDAKSFGRELAQLRADVEAAGFSDVPDHVTDSLVSRIEALHKVHKKVVHWRYHQDLVSELNDMAIRISGKPLKEAKKKEAQVFRRPVPDEVGPIFGRQVVSGGLPTLGRRKH